MTIAKRLILLVAVPFLLLTGIWVVNRVQMARVEERLLFLTESRVVAVARLGDISRSFAEMRVAELAKAGKVEEAEALRCSPKPDELKMNVNGIFSGTSAMA